MDLYLEFLLVLLLNQQIGFQAFNITQPLFSCRVCQYSDLRKVNNRIALHKELFRMTIYQPQDINISFLQSFQEQHSMVIHMQFSVFPLVYSDQKAQNLRFLYFYYDLAVDFRALSLYGQSHFYEYTRLLIKFAA